MFSGAEATTERSCPAAGRGGLRGEEEARASEAEGLQNEGRSGDAVGRGDEFGLVVVHGDERLGLAVEDREGGRLADVLDCEAEADGGFRVLKFSTADEVEEAVAVAEQCDGLGDRIPEDVAEAAQRGGDFAGVSGDAIPVGGGGDACRRADQFKACG